ncbi:hypothetical protein D3C87_1626980 [compost metagenome]
MIFSLLIAFNSIASLKGIFLSFLMVLIPEITSIVLSKSEIKSALNAFNSGQVETIKASSGVLSANICQISSVKKGINGCNNFRLLSNISIALSNVTLSIGC